MLIIETRNALPGSTSRGRHWLRTAAFALVGISLAVVAFFFIAVALVVGACLALGIAVRWWWVMRRLRAQARTAGPLEGEYAVIEESPESRQPRR
jgi:Flp pilus assembly protein TadB